MDHKITNLNPKVQRVLDISMETAVKVLGDAGGDLPESTVIEAIKARFSGVGPDTLHALAAAVLEAFDRGNMVVRLGPKIRFTQEGWRAYRTGAYRLVDQNDNPFEFKAHL